MPFKSIVITLQQSVEFDCWVFGAILFRVDNYKKKVFYFSSICYYSSFIDNICHLKTVWTIKPKVNLHLFLKCLDSGVAFSAFSLFFFNFDTQLLVFLGQPSDLIGYWYSSQLFPSEERNQMSRNEAVTWNHPSAANATIPTIFNWCSDTFCFSSSISASFSLRRLLISLTFSSASLVLAW